MEQNGNLEVMYHQKAKVFGTLKLCDSSSIVMLILRWRLLSDQASNSLLIFSFSFMWVC